MRGPEGPADPPKGFPRGYFVGRDPRYSQPIMEHLILAVYVVLFASGFAGIAALVFLRIRVRGAIVSDFIGVQTMLLLGLAIVLAYFYLDNVVAVGGRDADPVLGPIALLSTCVQGVLYLFAARMTRRIRTGGRLRPRLRDATTVLCLLVAATSFLAALEGPIDAILHSALKDALARLSALSGGGYVLVCAALLFLALCLRLAPMKAEHPAVLLLVRGWSYALFAFCPLTVLEWVLEALVENPYKPLSLDFIFYFACNLVCILAFARSLRVESRTGEAALASSVPAEAALRFSLTAREQDMVPLIARGLANKEIAAELGISSATVRTHIYNLFRKAGARSRIELLNRLGS